jgi:hypothetical protein
MIKYNKYGGRRVAIDTLLMVKWRKKQGTQYMARLPVPGEDKGSWGDILNDFLLVDHNSDGSLKLGGTLGSYAPLDNPIFTGTVTVPNPSSATDAVTKSYVDTLVGGVSAPDATTSTKGVVQLAGDLSGTATNPQIADGAITNANINAAAGIAQNKIADLTTDLSSKQPLDADLTTVAGLSPNNDDVFTAQRWRLDKPQPSTAEARSWPHQE